MSLIIAYIGKKGCVMASDKRRIAYFGEVDKREELEQELYSGKITNDNELYKRASELGVVLKITDDANKIKSMNKVIMGEVSSKSTFETKRKRIYGTTNGYQIVELLGSEITSREEGENAIILFGNKVTKSLANKLIKQEWKPSLSLKYMGDVFENILGEIAKTTPSVGKESNVLFAHNNALTKETAQKYLNDTIERDTKVLTKFRAKLTEEIIEKNKTIELASKIIDEGEVGKVVDIEDNIIQVSLNDNIQAFDTNWKQLAKPGEKVIMFLDGGNSEDIVKLNDKVVIKGENLCLDKNDHNLNCDIILCNK